MKRIFAVLAVVALMATMMVSAMPAFAFANPDNNGNEEAPGQARAIENCGTVDGGGVLGRQAAPNSPPESNSHPHSTTAIAPANCNHFFTPPGQQ